MAQAGKIRCLVIDDDEDDFLLARDVLTSIQSQDHAVAWAAEYATGFELLGSGNYDVCLVDYRIGARTGVDFIRDSIAAGCQVPMILLTGMASREVDLEAMAAGAYDFMQKDSLSSGLLERSIRYAIAQAEQHRALVARTALLKATLDHTGAGIAAFDQNLRLETFNNRFFEVLEIEEATAGLLERALEDPGSRERLGRIVIERLKGFEAAAAMHFEFEVVEQGRTVEVRHNIAPDGRHVLVCLDITPRKEIERALVASREAALAASERKSEFLAVMSHELRTPLNAIIGFSELIKDQVVGDIGVPAYVDFASDIHASGSRLLRLVDNILTFVKLETGRHEQKDQDFVLSDMVKTCVRLFGPSADEKRLRLENRAGGTAWIVRGDELGLRNALMHLVSNAIKFTDSGGWVSVDIESTDDGGLAVIVEDSGVGISPEGLEVCREPFRQADVGLARRHEGTGLGLPIVDWCARLHQGRLDISSTPGVGTRASLVIPAARWSPSADQTVGATVPRAAVDAA